MKEWDKSFGGKGLEYLLSLQQTADGGYTLRGIPGLALAAIKQKTAGEMQISEW